MIRLDFFQPDFSKVQDLLEDKSMTDRIMARMALEQIARIKLRTAEGEDVNEKAFEPYSKAWADVREKKGLQIDVVDLFFEGKMLASMDYQVTDFGEVEIYFTDALQGAKAHGHTKGSDRVPQREFFAMSEEDQEQMQLTFYEEWLEALNEVVRLF